MRNNCHDGQKPGSTSLWIVTHVPNSPSLPKACKFFWNWNLKERIFNQKYWEQNRRRVCSRLPYSVSLGYRVRAVTHNRNYYLFIPACRIVVFLIDRHHITFFVHIGRELRGTFRSRSFVFTMKLKQRGNTVISRHLLRIYSGSEIMSLQVLSNNAQ